MKQNLMKFLILIPCYLSSNFSYAGFDFCPENNDSGEGGSNTFQQQIPLNGIVEVGELPIGISRIDIHLNSNVDIDIQLYDKITGEKMSQKYTEGFKIQAVEKALKRSEAISLTEMAKQL